MTSQPISVSSTSFDSTTSTIAPVNSATLEANTR